MPTEESQLNMFEAGNPHIQEFEALLRSTKRAGVESVITHLKELGFYEAPASTKFHLNCKGGLLEHSMSVYKVACALREAMISLKPELAEKLPKESIIIATLLHDTCKAEIYKLEQKWRKDAQNKWESYEAYGVDYTEFPLGHGEKSVIRLLQWGLQMTDDEIIAIRWHMQAWDLPFQSPEAKANYTSAGAKCPLLELIQSADGMSTKLLEE